MTQHYYCTRSRIEKRNPAYNYNWSCRRPSWTRYLTVRSPTTTKQRQIAALRSRWRGQQADRRAALAMTSLQTACPGRHGGLPLQKNLPTTIS